MMWRHNNWKYRIFAGVLSLSMLWGNVDMAVLAKEAVWVTTETVQDAAETEQETTNTAPESEKTDSAQGEENGPESASEQCKEEAETSDLEETSDKQEETDSDEDAVSPENGEEGLVFPENEEEEYEVVYDANGFGWDKTGTKIVGYRGEATDIVIPAKAVEIEDNAFENDGITSVDFSQSQVTRIGENAFSRKSIETLVLPASLTELGAYAFSYNKKLKTVVFPSKKLFENISESEMSYLFRESTISSLTLPDGMEEIPEDMFTQVTFTGEEDIVIPASVKKIGNGAFYQSTGIGKRLKFAQNSKLETLGANCFSRTDLSEIQLPVSLKTIEEQAFNKANLTEIEVPDQVAKIGYQAFAGQGNASPTILRKAVLPKSVTEMDTYVFGTRVDCLAEIYVYKDSYAHKWLLNNGLSKNVVLIGTETIIGDFAWEGTTIKRYVGTGPNVVIPAEATAIADYAFARYDFIESVDFTQSKVKVIGVGAFETSYYTDVESKLKSVKLPETLTEIGDEAFISCSQLKEITIPKNVKKIGRDAFAFCDALETVDIKATTLEAGTAFGSLPSLKNVYLPEGMTTLSERIFSNSKFAPNTVIKLPSTLKVIEHGAFEYNPNLTGVILQGNALQKIGSGAFMESGIQEFTITSGVTSLGGSAFANSGLKKLTIDSCNLTPVAPEYPSKAFQGCTGLTTDNLILNEKMTYIPTNLFDGAEFGPDADGRVIFHIPANVTVIKMGAFQGSNIEKFVFDGNAVKKIEDGAFSASGSEINGCELELPDGVTEIEDGAIYCTDLRRLKKLVLPASVTKIGTGTENGLLGIEGDPEKIYVQAGSYAEKWVKQYKKNSTIITAYSIKYVMDGGKNHPDNPAVFEKGGAPVVFKEPTKAGYRFGGWFKDSAFSNPITDTTGATSNLTVYAKWIPIMEFTNVEGGYLVSLDGVEYKRVIDPIEIDTTKDFTFYLKPDAGFTIKAIELKLGTKSKITVEGKQGNDDVYTCVVPAGKITDRPTLSVTTVAFFYTNQDANIGFTITNQSAVRDNAKGRYDTVFGATEVAFDIAVKENMKPSVVIKADGKEDIVLKHNKLVAGKTGIYTYSYTATVDELGGRTLDMSAVEQAARLMTIYYDAHSANVSARVGARLLPREMSNEESVVYKVPIGSTVTIRSVAKTNCKITGITYEGMASKGNLKTALDVNLKPIEDVDVRIATTELFAPAVYVKKDGAGAEEAQNIVKNSITVNAEDICVVNIRKGFAGIDKTAKINLMNGKTSVTEAIQKIDGREGEYQISNLKNYAGKTLTIAYYANGSTKAVNVKLVVRGTGKKVKSVKLNGKATIAQMVGTTVTYKVNVAPATINTAKMKAVVRSGPAIIKEDSIATEGTLTVTLPANANAATDTKVEFYYIGGGANHSYEDCKEDYLISSFVIKSEAYTKYTKVAPAVKLATATDIDLTLALTLPNGFSEKTQYLYYAISAEAVGSSVPEQMLASIPVSYVPVTGKTQYVTIPTAKPEIARGAGTAQKYNVQVHLVLSSAEQATAVDTTENTGNVLATSKVKTLATATRVPAYEKKLTVKKNTVKFYAAQKMADGSALLVATVKYSNTTTFQKLGDVYTDDVTMQDNVRTEKYFDIRQVDEAGTTMIYLSLKDGVNVNDVTPGVHTLNLVSYTGDSGQTPVSAKVTFTILNPIVSLKVTTTAAEMVKVDKKPLTVKPAITYTGIGSAVPSAKKVTWSVECADEELMKAITLNKKNGAVTISKDYMLPADAEPVFRIIATAADYSGNTVSGSVDVKLKN